MTTIKMTLSIIILMTLMTVLTMVMMTIMTLMTLMTKISTMQCNDEVLEFLAALVLGAGPAGHPVPLLGHLHRHLVPAGLGWASRHFSNQIKSQIKSE